jgi:hypothetical protein
LQTRIGGGAGELVVPGAGFLAEVAAEEPVADQRALGVGERAAAFDRQVGDAAARVELARGGQGAGRAGVEAGAAGAAVVGGEGSVDGEIEVGEDAADVVRRYDIDVTEKPLDPLPGDIETAFKDFGFGECMEGNAGAVSVRRKVRQLRPAARRVRWCSIFFSGVRFCPKMKNPFRIVFICMARPGAAILKSITGRTLPMRSAHKLLQSPTAQSSSLGTTNPHSAAR